VCHPTNRPALSLAQDVVVWDYWQGIGSAQLVPANTVEITSLQATGNGGGTGNLAFCYKLIAPLIPSSGGWAVLGEPHKLTPVSEQRNWQFEQTDESSGSLTVKVINSEALGEVVTVAAWKAGKVYTQTAQIDSKGEGVFVFDNKQ
jgi:hypothetical protein